MPCRSSLRRACRAAARGLAAALLVGCGAKSALDVAAPVDDAGIGRDAGVDGGPPACVPSPERCNLRDDDCDGVVDDGFGFGPLGPVTVLREDEFDTGPCDTCAWAWDTFVAPTTYGYLAGWYVGIYGGREMPNLFGRRLGPEGSALGPVERLDPDRVVLGLAPMTQAPIPGRGLPITTCLREGGVNDTFGWHLVDAAGAIDVVRPTRAARCSGDRFTVWTGERVLTAFDQAGAVVITTWRLDGSDRDETSFDVPDLLGVVPFAYRDRVAILGIIVRDGVQELWFARLDPRGRLVAEPFHLEGVPYDPNTRLVGTSDGWLAIAPGRSSSRAPATRQRLSVNGEVLSPPRPWDDGRFLQTAIARTIVHHPSEPAIVAVWNGEWDGDVPGDLHVELLDDAGDPTHAWTGRGPGTGAVVDPRAAFSNDRLTVVWHDLAGDAEKNRVYARQFGCLDE